MHSCFRFSELCRFTPKVVALQMSGSVSFNNPNSKIHLEIQITVDGLLFFDSAVGTDHKIKYWSDYRNKSHKQDKHSFIILLKIVSENVDECKNMK
jgi:hypothetical protein